MCAGPYCHLLRALKKPRLINILNVQKNTRKEKKMVSKFYSSLSQDLSLVLDDSDDYNVVIVVGKNQDIKEFRAHSVILCARSKYFKIGLSTVVSNKNFIFWFIRENVLWIYFLTFKRIGQKKKMVFLSLRSQTYHARFLKWS